MIRTHEAGALRATDVGSTVTLAGWVDRRRDHGGVAFLDLRDVSGVSQVVVNDEEVAHPLRSEFCLRVTGRVERRPAGNENPSLPSGEVEVVADEVGELVVVDVARGARLVGALAPDRGERPQSRRPVVAVDDAGVATDAQGAPPRCRSLGPVSMESGSGS